MVSFRLEKADKGGLPKKLFGQIKHLSGFKEWLQIKP